MKSLILLMIFTFGQFAHAEPAGKHPRVAELEDSLRDTASTYLKARFPDQPYVVNVSVDPVRRNTAAAVAEKDREDLPYYDDVETGIVDEWDNPEVSLHQLIARTKKIQVDVSLSENVSDSERVEVKEALMRSLHLVDARDEVSVETRKWSSGRVPFNWMLVGFAAFLLLIGAMVTTQSIGYRKLTKALSSGTGNGGGATQAAAPASAPQVSRQNDAGPSGPGSKVELSDPLKIRQMMRNITSRLPEDLPNFPGVSAMILLDRYGEKNPRGLGAILHELPAALQKRILSLSNGSHWLEAFLDPGIIEYEQVHLFQKAVRGTQILHAPEFENTLVKVWRLKDELEGFLRTQPKGVVLSVLSGLPKEIAIGVARRVIPGGWADLLNPQFKPEVLTPQICNGISEAAERLVPLLTSDKLDYYRMVSDLIEYLKTASPEEEREIYLAADSKSIIHQTRIPFFPVFECEEGILKDFVSQFNVQQWALALFNVNRSDRKKIQAHFSEKQSFRFVEQLKVYDLSTPEPKSIAEARAAIAKRFKEFKTLKVVSSTDTKDAPHAQAA
jgi:hypothetical protein